MMDLNHLLGTPDTSLSGLNTLNALKALTSNPSFITVDKTVLIILQFETEKIKFPQF